MPLDCYFFSDKPNPLLGPFFKKPWPNFNNYAIISYFCCIADIFLYILPVLERKKELI